MFFTSDNTQSFEYKRNEFCHKILDALYFHAKPTIREGTIGNSIKGKEGVLISNSYFPLFDVSELHKELDTTDAFIQDCCHLLETNKHIEPRPNPDNLFKKIKFTEAGVIAFKADYYLDENQKRDWTTEIHNSTVFNNRWTPIIAALAFFISLFTFISDLIEHKEQSVSQQQFQKQLQSIDSIRQIQTDALYILLTNIQKSTSYNDTSKTKTK